MAWRSLGWCFVYTRLLRVTVKIWLCVQTLVLDFLEVMAFSTTMANYYNVMIRESMIRSIFFNPSQREMLC